MTRRIMVVDDDALIRETLVAHFRDGGIDVSEAASAEQALATVGRAAPDVVITDVRMGGMDGLTLLRTIKERLPDVMVLVMTAFEDMRTAIGAMKAGAHEYLVKPLDLDQIDLVVERCFRERALARRAGALAEQAAEPYALDQLVGRDPRMIEIYKTIGAAARTRAPVLIRGETGTGKEVIARAVHFNSDDAREPFVAVNCTAVPEALLESELFGHVRGAFTGAVGDRKGRFELAGAGTIFLDEIGDTTPAFQAKLLRVLQERTFTPVGAEQTRRTEARVIAATHRPLEQLMREGRFREDLYFRLRVVEIVLPTLRERRGDIGLLADHLLRKASAEMHRAPARLTPGALQRLIAYDWPGNVRELENALTRALVMVPASLIGENDLLLGAAVRPSSASEEAPEDRTMNAVERHHVERVLRECHYNKRQTCRVLGVSRPRLDRLLEKHGIVVTDRDHQQ